MSRWCNWWM